MRGAIHLVERVRLQAITDTDSEGRVVRAGPPFRNRMRGRLCQLTAREVERAAQFAEDITAVFLAPLDSDWAEDDLLEADSETCTRLAPQLGGAWVVAAVRHPGKDHLRVLLRRNKT